MPEKHYWKKNEIILLKNLVLIYTGTFMIHWSKVQEEFNRKYSYDLTIPELKEAYERYYGGKKR